MADISIRSLIYFSTIERPLEYLPCARHCAEHHRHGVKLLRSALGRSLLRGEEEGPTSRPLNTFSVGLLPVALLRKLPLYQGIVSLNHKYVERTVCQLFTTCSLGELISPVWRGGGEGRHMAVEGAFSGSHLLPSVQ